MGLMENSAALVSVLGGLYRMVALVEIDSFKNQNLQVEKRLLLCMKSKIRIPTIKK